MKREDYEKLSTDDQISYWKGQMLFGIGKGDLNTEIFRMMDFLHRLGYERGSASIVEKNLS